MKYDKLPKLFKSEWLEALRSGKYQQGYERLMADGKYCCLGVACVVGGVEKVSDHMCFIPTADLDPKNEFKNIPDILRADHLVTQELVRLNDVDGASFKEIADWIEENL